MHKMPKVKPEKPVESESVGILKNAFLKLEDVWAKLGPGLITGASDDDPSGITTYSQAGAQFGFGTLWTALITFPLMASIQEMCGRVGLVTNKGIAGVLKENYPKYIIYLVALVTVPASIINIGSDLAGMGAVANLIFPQVPVEIFTIFAAFAIIAAIIFFSYKQLSFVMKWLTLILLVYLVVPFLVKQNLWDIFTATVIPHVEFSVEFVSILVAILGTTISPYLFFWEASMEVEEHELKERQAKILSGTHETLDQEVKEMQKDNFVGMFFSNFVMFFIILTAGSILFKGGINNIDTVDQAASALKPLAGDGAYLLFALGVIGTGFLAIPVLAGACSYVISETLGWNMGMNLKLKEAKGFYLVIIISVILGLLINFLGISPIQAMIWTAVIYGIVSPVLIGVILHVCNNKKVMGKYTNGKWSNILGILCFLMMTVAVIGLFITFFM
jgi:NRAMP (natural resistance-associated macrophage protein)-like metal ion transporter